MAHTGDPLNSTPLSPNAGDQSAPNEVSRELLDQLASTFRPSWELDAATFSGPSDLSSTEIQALQSGGGTAAEVRGQAHASIRPLPPPKPTEISEPPESVIVQDSPAPADSALPVDVPAQGLAAGGASVGTSTDFQENTLADVSPPFLHEAPDGTIPAPFPEQLASAPEPAPAPPSFHPAALAPAEPAGGGSVWTVSPVSGEPMRASVRPAAFPMEGPARLPSTRPAARTSEFPPAAAHRPSRPPLPSLDFEVQAFARRSKAPLWIGVGIAVAALAAVSGWVLSESSSSSSSATPSAAQATVETPPAAAAAPTPRAEATAEVPPSPPQPNPLAVPPPAFPTAAAAEAPATPSPTPPTFAASALPPAPRPAPHPMPAAAPKPAPHPKAGNPTIVRDVPF